MAPLLAQTLTEPIWSSIPSQFSLHLCGIYQCTHYISLYCMLQDPEWVKITVIVPMTADAQGPQKLSSKLSSLLAVMPVVHSITDSQFSGCHLLDLERSSVCLKWW